MTMGLLDIMGVTLLPMLVGCLMTSPFSLTHVWSNCQQALAHSLSAVSKRKLVASNASSAVPIKVPIQLPVDVLLHVLEHAYYDNHLQPNVQLLANCSLVNKEWSIHAQTLLFRHVNLRTHSAFESFRRAVDPSTEKGRTLGDSVARLRVILDHKHPDQLSDRAFAQAVSMCPSLFELDVSVFGRSAPNRGIDDGDNMEEAVVQTPSFDAGVLSLLRSGPRISALQFGNWSDNDQLAKQLLAGVWPSLTSVVLKGLPPSLHSSPSSVKGEAAVPSFPCALHELHVNFQSSPKAEVLRWLLQASSCTLRVLRLEQEIAPELLKVVVRQHKSTLQSLSMPACNSPELAALVQECVGLKELQIEDPHVSPLIFKKLPQELRHLAITIDRDTQVHAVINGLGAAQSLKFLTVCVGPEGAMHPSLPGLKIACAYNGIHLTREKCLQRFRTIMRGDLVPESSFPRFKDSVKLRKMLALSRSLRDRGDFCYVQPSAPQSDIGDFDVSEFPFVVDSDEELHSKLASIPAAAVV